MKIQEEESVTIHKANTQFQIEMKRTAKGLLVVVKADKTVEDLFAEWSNGLRVTHDQHGRHWAKGPGQDKLPPLYALSAVNLTQFTSDKGPCRLDRVGVPIADDYGTNLGWLRFEGISEGRGVAFVIKGVFSAEEVKKLAERVKAGVKSFYINFMKPVDIVITMSTTEMKG